MTVGDRGAEAMVDEGAAGWQRTLWLMVVVQFVMSAALSTVVPFLPLYLIQLHVHPLALVDLWSGVIISINFLIAAVVSPVWGRLADRYGRKAMLLRTSAAICVTTAFTGAAQNVWEVFALRAVQGGFTGFAAAAVTLTGTIVPDARLGFALGWLSTGQLLGALAGPLAGGALASVTTGYRPVFYFVALLAGITIVLIGTQIRERFVRSPNPMRQGGWAGWMALLRTPGLRSTLVVLFLVQFSIRGAQPVVTIFVRQLVGTTPHLAALAGVAFAIVGLGDLVASPFLGKRSDRLGYRRILTICLAGAAVMSAVESFSPSITAFLALQLVLGMFLGGILPTANALVGRSAPRERRGEVYGIAASATFLGSFAGPLITGLVAALFGVRVIFVLIGVVLTVALWWVRFGTVESTQSG